MRGAEVGLALSVLALVLAPAPMPIELILLLVAYFVGFTLYASIAFLRGSMRSRGVTRRRLQAVALGSGFVGLDILVVGLGVALPRLSGVWGVLGPLFGMASGLAYWLGFAPPTWLRRAWQEPELRAFLGRAAALPYLPETRSIIAELERGAAAATGARGASIGLVDQRRRALMFFEASQTTQAAPGRPVGHAERTDDGWRVDLSAPTISARVARAQAAMFVQDVARDDPANALAYEAFGSRAAVGAPIMAGGHLLGVLVVYAPRAPMFADSDIELVQLLADQAAVILESRKLLDQAAQAQARAEATRLKDDFLSSAAHDLKTPITGILTQAQVVRRRLEQQTNDPLVPAGIDRIIREARRLSALVLELLDVPLLEQGRLVSGREPVDLVELVTAECARYARGPVPCRVEARPPVVASVDPARIRQVVQQLIDNAVKFSPPGAEVLVRVWRVDDQARLEVRDRGIGIPAQDVPRLFERFHRGSNVDDRRFAGLGLGLYLSRGIVEQHGGQIWVADNPGGGSAFSISLPLASSPASAPALDASVALNGG
jgi:signal transduction histidine kinase